MGGEIQAELPPFAMIESLGQAFASQGESDRDFARNTGTLRSKMSDLFTRKKLTEDELRRVYARTMSEQEFKNKLIQLGIDSTLLK